MNDEAGAVTRAVRRAGAPLLRHVRRFRQRHELREALATIHRTRGARLVLMYHRVSPREVASDGVVPTIDLDLFRAHLTILGELGRVTSLRSLLDPADEQASLRFALTFDDDYVSHVRYVRPVLRDFGLHGTFFLSGRSLHGLGAYWFERLEALVAELGLRETAALLGLPEAAPPAQLALLCEADLSRQALIDRYAPPADSPLDADGIRVLVADGMGVGFHTLHHPVLPALSDDAQFGALIEGRARLAGLVGATLEWLAYPHGKANAHTLVLAREAGYTAAWTTHPHVLRAGEDPLQYGRWAPRPLPTDALVTWLGNILQHAGGPHVPHAS